MKSLPKTKTAADLRQVSITTHPGAEEAVTALVGRVSGQTPSVYADMATGLTTVSAYLPLPDAKVATTRAALRAGLAGLEDAGIDAAPGRIAIRRVKPLDWSESWKRHFRPIEIGASLLVRPTWSRRKPKAGQQVVLLDPGLSFGTGQHATTHF